MEASDLKDAMQKARKHLSPTLKQCFNKITVVNQEITEIEVHKATPEEWTVLRKSKAFS